MRSVSSATSQRSVQRAKRDLQRFLKKMHIVPSQILADEAVVLKAEIIAEVPYDTGRLERSVRVSVAKDKKRPGLNASASARNPNTGYNYAGIQHENSDYKHTKGKDHFISDPFERTTERIVQRMREELKP